MFCRCGTLQSDDHSVWDSHVKHEFGVKWLLITHWRATYSPWELPESKTKLRYDVILNLSSSFHAKKRLKCLVLGAIRPKESFHFATEALSYKWVIPAPVLRCKALRENWPPQSYLAGLMTWNLLLIILIRLWSQPNNTARYAGYIFLHSSASGNFPARKGSEGPWQLKLMHLCSVGETHKIDDIYISFFKKCLLRMGAHIPDYQCSTQNSRENLLNLLLNYFGKSESHSWTVMYCKYYMGKRLKILILDVLLYLYPSVIC